MMIPSKFENAYRECLNQVNIDFMPFHDIYRTIFGYDKLYPTEIEFYETIELFELLISRDEIFVSNEIGIDFKNKAADDIISFLTLKWKNGGYDEFSFSVWLDVKSS
jgi:hypothetical protein